MANRWRCTSSATKRLKSAHMDCLLWYMVINDLSDIKQKVFTFKHSLNRGIHSSPSKISMQNSVIQALLTRICLIRLVIIIIIDFTSWPLTLRLTVVAGGNTEDHGVTPTWVYRSCTRRFSTDIKILNKQFRGDVKSCLVTRDWARLVTVNKLATSSS